MPDSILQGATSEAGGIVTNTPKPARILRERWWYLGPAFVASVAYMDPGNFATNIEAGARFGYELLWVLLWSNAMAILVQYLAAKLGIATGHTLPENCRNEFSRIVRANHTLGRGEQCGFENTGVVDPQRNLVWVTVNSEQ